MSFPSLLGAAKTLDETSCLVMEYMSHGSLAEQLWKYKKELERQVSKHVLSPRILNRFLVDICNGMTEMEAKQLIHRDLAARNVMISEDLTAKIGDFGLSRDAYQDRCYLMSMTDGKKKKIPYYWMAPESLSDFRYTTKSDVWSFGIVLWEVASLGSRPYPNILPAQLNAYLAEGNRMEKPPACPGEWYKIMCHCWKNDIDRPTFIDLHKSFDSLYSQAKCYLNVDAFRGSHFNMEDIHIYDTKGDDPDNNQMENIHIDKSIGKRANKENSPIDGTTQYMLNKKNSPIDRTTRDDSNMVHSHAVLTTGHDSDIYSSHIDDNRENNSNIENSHIDDIRGNDIKMENSHADDFRGNCFDIESSHIDYSNGNDHNMEDSHVDDSKGTESNTANNHAIHIKEHDSNMEDVHAADFTGNTSNIENIDINNTKGNEANIENSDITHAIGDDSNIENSHIYDINGGDSIGETAL